MNTKPRIVLVVEQQLLKEHYRILSELWEPKSKHKTHLKIGSEMDRVLGELEKVKKDLEIPK
jgi:hypothetical protein